MYCGMCGKLNKDDARFCDFCGSSLSDYDMKKSVSPFYNPETGEKLNVNPPKSKTLTPIMRRVEMVREIEDSEEDKSSYKSAILLALASVFGFTALFFFVVFYIM